MAVDYQTAGVDIQAIGVILMVVGVIGLVFSLLFLASFAPFGGERGPATTTTSRRADLISEGTPCRSGPVLPEGPVRFTLCRRQGQSRGAELICPLR